MIEKSRNPDGGRKQPPADNTGPKKTKADKQYDEIQSNLAAIKISINRLVDAITAQNGQSAAKPEESKWIRRSAVSTIVYAALTVVIVLLGLYQGYLGRETFTGANRAWIAPVFMMLTNPIESGTVKYQLHIENVGHEPVVKAVYGFRTFTVPYIAEGGSNATGKLQPNDTCKTLSFGKDKGLVSYPGTSGKFWLVGEWIGDGDQKAVASEVISRTGSLIVEGCILYETMGRERFTAFRFFLRDIPGSSFAMQKGDDGKDRFAPAWMFNLAETGNDAS